MFGSDILAAPVVTPVNNATNTTEKAIWLPPGNWVDFWTFKSYTGPLEFNLTVGLPDLPLFVVAGSIIPFKTMASVTNYNPDPLLFAIFPGASEGSTTYYEDDGNTTQYLTGAYAFTPVNYATQSSTTKVVIGATEGTFTGQPTTRTYQVVLKGVTSNPSSVTANGQTLNPVTNSTLPGWWIDSTLSGLVVQPSPVSIQSATTIVIEL